mgnify:CR=1 FL=1
MYLVLNTLFNFLFLYLFKYLNLRLIKKNLFVIIILFCLLIKNNFIVFKLVIIINYVQFDTFKNCFVQR